MIDAISVRLLPEKDLKALPLLAFLFLAVFLINGLVVDLPFHFLLPVSFLIAIAALVPAALETCLFWLAMFLFAFATFLTDSRFILPNHFYYFTYWMLALSCVFFCAEDERERCLRANATALLFLVMAMAGIHKLLSVNFATGAMAHIGAFTGELPSLGNAWLEAFIQANQAMLWDLKRSGAPFQLESPEWAASAALTLSWVVIAWELAIPCLLLLKGKLLALGHVLVLGFFGPAAMLDEYQFGYLIAMAGYFACPTNYKKLRLAYLFSCLAFFLLLIVEQA